MNPVRVFQSFISSLAKILIPGSIRLRLDAENFGLVKFMEFASREVKPEDRVLDAGAGGQQYRKYFSHAKYESTDFVEAYDNTGKSIHDFICSLDNIPKPDGSYDVIINTQVLEHVEYPQKVINEFYRILRPGGKLFLTAPQGWGLHCEPYNFYNFTKYGLRSLFEHAGFQVGYIKPRGGMFWYLGYELKIFPSYILGQYVFEYGEYTSTTRFKPKPLALLLVPIYILTSPFWLFIIPLLFFYLDRIDKRQGYTLGYAAYCVKKAK
jgi:SAM-dependent methyltransferase